MPRIKVVRRVQLGMLLEPGEVLEVSEEKARRVLRRYRKHFVDAGEEAGETIGVRQRRERTTPDPKASDIQYRKHRPLVENRMAEPEDVT